MESSVWKKSEYLYSGIFEAFISNALFILKCFLIPSVSNVTGRTRPPNTASPALGLRIILHSGDPGTWKNWFSDWIMVLFLEYSAIIYNVNKIRTRVTKHQSVFLNDGRPSFQTSSFFHYFPFMSLFSLVFWRCFASRHLPQLSQHGTGCVFASSAPSAPSFGPDEDGATLPDAGRGSTSGAWEQWWLMVYGLMSRMD